MIIVKTIQEYCHEIELLLDKAVEYLEAESKSNSLLIKLSGTAFEKEVCNALNVISIGTSFDNCFEQASAHAFPDIFARLVTNEWFGVEVKTSQGDWKCFGNSIFESIRVPNLEDRIYVFFGKFSKQLNCKWARYQDCVDNINITHSPRYQINMEIVDDSSLSVFSKMETTYLEFQNSKPNVRMEYVRKFKRQGLGQDVALWWLPEHDNPTNEDEEKLVIKLFSALPSKKRAEIRYNALATFPEIFSNNGRNKYSRLPTWLASQHGVVMGNIRDLFSAGGQFKVEYNEVLYKLPKICYHIFHGVDQIKKVIMETNSEELVEKWGIEGISDDFSERIEIWMATISKLLIEQNGFPGDFPLYDWLNYIFIKNSV